MANTKKVTVDIKTTSNTKKVDNKTKRVDTKPVEPVTTTFEKNLVKKMKARKGFAFLSYCNNIFAVIAFIFTIATLFGARGADPIRFGGN
jgi:hypothetical protein